MIVAIHPARDCREYCIIELQGEVQHDEGLQQGFRIGTMTADASTADAVFLQIGYHRLEGKRVPLKAPIAVLRRSWPEQADSQADVVMKDAPQAAASCSVPEYHVHGQIRSKYIFRERPKVRNERAIDLSSTCALSVLLGQFCMRVVMQHACCITCKPICAPCRHPTLKSDAADHP